MTAFRVECPACHVSFPVDRETMRVKKYGYAHKVEVSKYIQPCGCDVCVAHAERTADRCQSPSCGCNRNPEDAA